MPIDFQRSNLHSNIDVILTAGETIAVNDCVYMEQDASLGTAGSVYKIDANNATKSSYCWFVGFAVSAGTAGTNVMVRIAGVVGGFTGLTAGVPQYASTLTTGTIMQTVPTNALQVGIALSSTQVLINDRGSQTAITVLNWGYFLGGNTSGGTVAVKTADKIIFSTDTTSASTASNLSIARDVTTGVSAGPPNGKGYVCGGNTASTNSLVTDKLIFSTSITTAQTTANLTFAREQAAGLSAGSDNNKGYVTGGDTSTQIASTDKIAFSTDITTASTATTLSQARNGMGGLSAGSANGKGYVLGGATAGAPVATTDKITFSSDVSAAQTTANLSQARQNMCGTISAGSATGKGYVMGGATINVIPVEVFTADKITFSSDVTVAQTTANLSQARITAGHVSAGSANGKGYVCGGGTNSGNAVATGDKIVFSSDVTAAQTTANLSQARGAATGIDYYDS